MIWTILVAMLFAMPAYGQIELNVAAVPRLDTAGREAYVDFLLTNLPRAFAVASNGAYGWQGDKGGSIENARMNALVDCAGKGGTDCALYAEDLDVVWHGRAPVPNLVPGAFTSTLNYEIAPDDRFFWHGPAIAAGVYVWGHGKGQLNGAGGRADSRGRQSQAHVRALNDVGFDIVRFDRDPNADGDRASRWLADALVDLRKRGYRRIVVGGQSRGGWTSLQMLTYAGVADAVIAVSPSAHGYIGAASLSAQYDDLHQIISDVPPEHTRLAVVQFTGDPFASDLARRTALIERLRPKLGGLLVIDRPPGTTGHYGGSTGLFAQRYGECLRRFVMDAMPPTSC